MFQSELPAVMDSVEANLLDLFITKFWAIKFASVAACTVLRVDQVSTLIVQLLMPPGSYYQVSTVIVQLLMPPVSY